LEPPIKEPNRKKLLDTVLPFYALHTGPAPSDEKGGEKKAAPAAGAAAQTPLVQAGDKESLEMVISNLNTLLASLVHVRSPCPLCLFLSGCKPDISLFCLLSADGAECDYSTVDPAAPRVLGGE
jgi:hypothetical protein